MNLGFAELAVLLLLLLAALMAGWLVNIVLSQGHRIAHLERRLETLERRGPA